METQVGRFDFDDGGTYIGQWFKGYAHGLGLAIGPNGVGEYSGEWDSGFETCGVYIWPSGNRYTGTWSKGKRHGDGQQIRGKWIYQGQFSNGSCGPLGVKSMANSATSYEGSWNVNRFEGFGIETCADGSVYAGEWTKGVRHGLGVRRAFAQLVEQGREQPLNAKVSQVSEGQQQVSIVSGSMEAVPFERDTKCPLDANEDRKPSTPMETFRVSKKAQIGRAIMKRLRKQHSAMELECSTDSNRFYPLGKSICDPDNSRLLRSPGAPPMPDVVSRSQISKAASSKEAGLVNENKHSATNGKSSNVEASGFAEVYSGQWFEDKRSGYGITERSDGYKYVGEWSKNQRHGFGIAQFPDGTKEEGDFQADQLIVRLSRKSKLQMLRHNKLKECVDSAVSRAVEVANEARVKSVEQAEKQAELARIASKKAEEIIFKARCLSQKARFLVREIEPEFKQPGLQWETKRHASNPSTSRPLGTTSDTTILCEHPTPDVDELGILPPKPGTTPSALRLGKLWRSKMVRAVTNRLISQDTQSLPSTSTGNVDIYERFAKIGNPCSVSGSMSPRLGSPRCSIVPQQANSSYDGRTKNIRLHDVKRVSILEDKWPESVISCRNETKTDATSVQPGRQRKIKRDYAIPSEQSPKTIVRRSPLIESVPSPKEDILGDNSRQSYPLLQGKVRNSSLTQQTPIQCPGPSSAYSPRSTSMPRELLRNSSAWSTSRQYSLPNASSDEYRKSPLEPKPLGAQSYSRTARAETPQESELESEYHYDQKQSGAMIYPSESPKIDTSSQFTKSTADPSKRTTPLVEPLHAPKLGSRHTQDSGYLSMDPSDRSFSIRTLSHSLSHQISQPTDKVGPPRMEGLAVYEEETNNKQSESVSDAGQLTVPAFSVFNSKLNYNADPPDPKRPRSGKGNVLFSEQGFKRLLRSKRKRTSSRSGMRFRSPGSAKNLPELCQEIIFPEYSHYICNHNHKSLSRSLERKDPRYFSHACNYLHTQHIPPDNRKQLYYHYPDADTNSTHSSHSRSTAYSAPPCTMCTHVQPDLEACTLHSSTEFARTPIHCPSGNGIQKCTVLPTKQADSMAYPYFVNSQYLGTGHRNYCSRSQGHVSMFQQHPSESISNATRYIIQPDLMSSANNHRSVCSCILSPHAPVNPYGFSSNHRGTMASRYFEGLQLPVSPSQDALGSNHLYKHRTHPRFGVFEKRSSSVDAEAHFCPNFSRNNLSRYPEFLCPKSCEHEQSKYELSDVPLVNAPLGTFPQTPLHAHDVQGWNLEGSTIIDSNKSHDQELPYESSFHNDSGLRRAARRVSWPRQVYQQFTNFSKLVSRKSSERSNSSHTLVGSNSSPIKAVTSKPVCAKPGITNLDGSSYECYRRDDTNSRTNRHINDGVFLLTQYGIPWYLSVKVWISRHGLNLIPLLLNFIMLLLCVLIPYWTQQNGRPEPKT